MSANSDNLKRSYSEQLSDLDSRLGSTFDDGAVLAEIHVAIKGLLTNNGDSEARIRAILQKRFEAGDLRPESFELVQKMLDGILTEYNSTIRAGRCNRAGAKPWPPAPPRSATRSGCQPPEN